MVFGVFAFGFSIGGANRPLSQLMLPFNLHIQTRTRTQTPRRSKQMKTQFKLKFHLFAVFLVISFQMIFCICLCWKITLNRCLIFKHFTNFYSQCHLTFHNEFCFPSRAIDFWARYLPANGTFVQWDRIFFKKQLIRTHLWHYTLIYFKLCKSICLSLQCWFK